MRQATRGLCGDYPDRPVLHTRPGRGEPMATPPFTYARAASLDEAVELAAVPGTRVLAGGTNLLDLMEGGIGAPRQIVDITRIPELDRIELQPDGQTRIGALVRTTDLSGHPGFAERFPSVAEAVLGSPSTQLRDAATVGGNLLQRTRCLYFYDAARACNKREAGAGCDASLGFGRLHAILGANPACIATNPSDLCVPLAALGALVEIHGAGGRRDVALTALHRQPGDAPEHDTVLEPGELVVALRLPANAARFAAHSRYLKFRDRTNDGTASVSVAASLTLAPDGTIAEARLAFGGVAHKPWRVPQAEALLVGRTPSDAAFAEAADCALADADRPETGRPKVDLARRAAMRTLALAASGAAPRPQDTDL